MAMHQINPQGGKLAALDPIWERIRSEAEDIVHREPELATFIYSTVLHHNRLEDAVVHRLADRLDHAALSGDLIRQTYDEALRAERGEIGRLPREATIPVRWPAEMPIGGGARVNRPVEPEVFANAARREVHHLHEPPLDLCFGDLPGAVEIDVE